MAHTSTHIGWSFASIFGQSGRIAQWVKSYKEAAALRRDYVNTLTQLENLSDRELEDINISRLNLAEVAREAVYGK